MSGAGTPPEDTFVLVGDQRVLYERLVDRGALSRVDTPERAESQGCPPRRFVGREHVGCAPVATLLPPSAPRCGY